jgi:hypothetical protein
VVEIVEGMKRVQKLKINRSVFVEDLSRVAEKKDDTQGGLEL